MQVMTRFAFFGVILTMSGISEKFELLTPAHPQFIYYSKKGEHYLTTSKEIHLDQVCLKKLHVIPRQVKRVWK